MPIVFHQSGIIYIRSLSTQLVLWLVERESLVTLGLFWWVHTCLEKELTYDRNHCFQQQIFGAYVDVNSGKLTGTSTGEILWEEVCVRDRELGCQVPL